MKDVGEPLTSLERSCYSTIDDFYVEDMLELRWIDRGGQRSELCIFVFYGLRGCKEGTLAASAEN